MMMLLWLHQYLLLLMFITYPNDDVTMVTPIPIIITYPNDSVTMGTPVYLLLLMFIAHLKFPIWS